MSLFSKALTWAAGAADSWLGTGNTISSAYQATESFITQGIDLVKTTGLDEYVSQAYGKNQTPYQAPEFTSPTAHKGVATSAGSFKASKSSAEMARTGMSNSSVQAAWKKASANPRIAAQIDIVRPNIGKRGPTKSLAEAKIG